MPKLLKIRAQKGNAAEMRRFFMLFLTINRIKCKAKKVTILLHCENIDKKRIVKSLKLRYDKTK